MALWEQGQEELSTQTQGGVIPTATCHFEEDHFGQSLSCKLKESPRAPLLGGVELREVALELLEGFIFKGEDKRGNIRKKGEKDPAHRGNGQFLHLHL